MAFTFFFRDRHTLEHFARLVTQDINNKSEVKIWDAGCAMGQEPYTLLIILAEMLSSNDYKKIKVIATDIDENSLFHSVINSGIYPYDQLSRLPEGILEKYFTKLGEDEYKLSDKILNSLSFTKQDLLELVPIDNHFDGIICKNVLLHFTPQQQIDVLKMYNNSLNNIGYLVTEQTQALPSEVSHKFEKVLSDANIYLKK